MARIRSAGEVRRRPAGPILGPPEPRGGASAPLPDRVPNEGRAGAGPRRTGWPPGPGRPAGGRSAGRAGVVASRGGAEDGRVRDVPADGRAPLPGCRLPAPEPLAGGADARASCAVPARPEAGDGARGAAEGPAGRGSAPAAGRGGPDCPAAGFGFAGAVPDEPGRPAAAGLRFTTTVRRGFFTTTMRRRSSPPPAAPAGRSSGRAAGGAIFGSGLRLIRVARGRGFSSVSGRSGGGLGDAVVFSSLILSKYNAVPCVCYIRFLRSYRSSRSHLHKSRVSGTRTTPVNRACRRRPQPVRAATDDASRFPHRSSRPLLPPLPRSPR